MYTSMLEFIHTVSLEEIKSGVPRMSMPLSLYTLSYLLDWLKGKIIIDSLGLHSNNQRHTNETEQILTSSDLIFVT